MFRCAACGLDAIDGAVPFCDDCNEKPSFEEWAASQATQGGSDDAASQRDRVEIDASYD